MTAPNYYAKNKGHIINLTTGMKLEFMENPGEIIVECGVKRASHAIPGLSHQRTQFIHTNNRKFKFTLMFDALSLGGPRGGRVRTEFASLFIQHLLYPRRYYRIDGAGNTPILFVMPGSHRVRGFMSGTTTIKEEMFFSDGALRRFTVDCEIVEEPRTKITSMEVLHSGLQSKSTTFDNEVWDSQLAQLEKERVRQGFAFSSTASVSINGMKVGISQARTRGRRGSKTRNNSSATSFAKMIGVASPAVSGRAVPR